MRVRSGESGPLRRRGRRLETGNTELWELPPSDTPDMSAECGLALGAWLAGRTGEAAHGGVLLVVAGEGVALVDRLTGEGEWIPDILVYPDVPLRDLESANLLFTVRWLATRLAPHRLWVATVPVDKPRNSGDETRHRSLRSILAAFREQQT